MKYPRDVKTLGSTMFCAKCGKEIPSGSPSCPACGYNPMGKTRRTRARHISVEDAMAEVRRAAHDLGRSAEALSRQVTVEARRAAYDPTGTARRATRKASRELHRVADEIERVLRDLK